jgi:DNA-binding CsgD family transcriptional regulator
MSRFATFLRAISQAPTAEQLKLRVMDDGCDALGSDKSGLYLLQPGTGRPAEIHVRHLQESFVVAYEQLGRDDDRVLAQVLRTRRAVGDAQVYPGESWRRSLLYRSFAGRYRIRRYLCAPIMAGPAVVGTLNMGRSCDDAPFDGLSLSRATAAGRAIGARLAELSRTGAAADAPLSLEESARLRADRALLRARLAEIESGAALLSRDATRRYWRALAHSALTPVDSFDSGALRYVLLRPEDLAPVRRRQRLTPRELDVLKRLAAGDTNKAIAYDLDVAESTVATHLSSAMGKLRVRSRVKLVEAARRL